MNYKILSLSISFFLMLFSLQSSAQSITINSDENLIELQAGVAKNITVIVGNFTNQVATGLKVKATLISNPFQVVSELGSFDIADLATYELREESISITSFDPAGDYQLLLSIEDANLNSNVVIVPTTITGNTDCNNITNPGQIRNYSPPSNYCPTEWSYNSISPATGGTGELEYRWIYYITDPALGGDFQVIPNSNSETIQFQFTQSTWHIRQARREACTEWISSNVSRRNLLEDVITINCKDYTIELYNNNATIVKEDVVGSADYICRPAFDFDIVPNTFTSPGVYEVSVTGTNINDFSGTCTSTVTVLAQTSISCSDNLLKNGGFEEGGQHWSLSYGFIISNDVNSGQKAATVQNPIINPPLPAGGDISQSITVTAGEKYQLNCFAKASGLGSKIFLIFYDQNDLWLGNNAVVEVPVSADYSELNISATVPTNAVKMVVAAIPSPDNSITADDFCLTKTITGGCTGDITLRTQAEVDAFDCSVIVGNLSINGLNSSITDLSYLSAITSVSGQLAIVNSDVINLAGLDNLRSVGDLVITLNQKLENINQLNNLAGSIGDLIIQSNDALLHLDGLGDISSIDDLQFSNNPSLQNIDGIQGLQNVSGSVFQLIDNESLQNLDGFQNINGTIKELIIINCGISQVNGLQNITDVTDFLVFSSCPNLVDLHGVSNVRTVGNDIAILLNPILTSLNGLENISSVSGLDIQNNTNLTDCCAIYNLLNDPNGVSGIINISNNPFSCSNESEILDNCISQDGIDLALSLTADNPFAQIYEYTNVTLTIRNDGQQTATQIKLELPDVTGLALDNQEVSQGSYFYFGQGVWDVGSLAAGESAFIKLRLFTLTENLQTIYAQVTQVNETDIDSSPNNNAGPNPTEDDEAAIQIGGDVNTDSPDLLLENLQTSISQATAGANIPFTFDLINQGQANASGDYVIHAFIATAYNASLTPDGFINTGNTPIGTISNVNGSAIVPNKAAGMYSLILFVDSNNDISEINEQNNIISIPFEIIEDNPTDGPTVTLSTASTNVSEPFTVNINFSESVTDLTLAEINVSNGTKSNAAQQSSSQYSFKVTPTSVGEITINIPAGIAFDNNENANQVSNTLIVNYDNDQQDGIDIELDMTIDKTDLNRYENYTYIITISNNGTAPASNLSVTVPKPASMAFTDSQVSQGSYFPWGDYIWTVGNLDAGQSATMEIIWFSLLEDQEINTYAEVLTANGNDADSTPGNGNGSTANEDDEANILLSPDTAAPRNGFYNNQSTTLKKSIAIRKVYPSPAINETTIQLLSRVEEEVSLKVYNSNGQEMSIQKLNITKGPNNINLNISAFPSGLYHLMIWTNKGTPVRHSFIKQRF